MVAVVDDIARPALTDRHLQCRQHELGAQMRLHRPADDPTAERIEHDSEIQEAGHCRNIGDVGDPKLVRAVGGEIPVHQVRRASRSRRVVMMARRRLTPTIPAARISRAIRFLPTARPPASS
jgi:peptidoglycan/xylan/chitin deacetylase (PgdA/CDA1 family)